MIVLADVLTKMAVEGESVMLGYGEDTAHWECSWVDAYGKRHTGVSKDLVKAVLNCMERAGLRIP